MNKIIFLADIDLSLAPKTRAEICPETVSDYASAYKRKEKLPMPVLYQVGGKYITADGVHRINALKAAGVKAATFEVRNADREHAIIFALQANIHHGLRRTNADKRQCVETAIMEFPDKSLREIAEICSVSDSLVKEVRSGMECVKKVESRTTVTDKKGVAQPAVKTKDGARTRTINDENKGKHEEKDTVDENPAPSVRAKNTPPVETDDTGYPIPEKAMVFWERAGEVDSILGMVSGIKGRITKAQSDKDPLYAEVNFSGILADLDKLYSGVKLALPYATCIVCQGKLPEKCKMCSGRGVISQFRWKTCVPKEFKEMRERMVKK